MAVVEIKDLKIGIGLPKICVPLVGTTDQELIEQTRKANQSNCDMLELRIDHYAKVSEVSQVLELLHKIRECTSMPLLFTFRTANEGGEKEISKKDYQSLYEEVIKSGAVELIDLELFQGEELIKPLIELAKQHGIKVVVSNHDFNKTPETKEMIERLLKMRKLEADIPKIAVMPQTKQDVLRLMEAILYVREQDDMGPLVGISMGELGMPSRMMGNWFHSSITFGVVSEASAPGQLSVKELHQVFEVIKKN